MSEADETKPTGVAARLARKNILELQPYRCARDDYSDGVLLDANENAYGPAAAAAAAENKNTLERYPDPHQIHLKEKLVAYRGNSLQAKNVFVGVGSDEAIDLLMRIFCRPGQDKILQTPPTYGMYKVCAKVNDVEVVNVPLTPDFDMKIDDVSTVESIVGMTHRERDRERDSNVHRRFSVTSAHGTVSVSVSVSVSHVCLPVLFL
jgi:histidinol-phosphate/aromatic aminotransferase/cobyric acid decarboxylase-like protein